MKRVLYIATTADNRNRLDGETIKCQLLREYLKNIENIQIICIDTDNWKKHIFKLIWLIITNYFKVDEIIVSSADRGSHIVIDFFRRIKCNKKIYYFVIGGTLAKNIKEKKWDISSYTRLTRIYVEAEIMKKGLEELGIDNVSVLNNFRKIGNFKNKYKKSNIFRFVYFGRVIREKGIEESIRLIKRLNNEKIRCTFDIYGQCSEEYLDVLKKNFDNNIKYKGEIKPDSITEYEILSQYDIFLFPTFYPGEGLPGSIIDAYISGLAIIASNWKYAKEYIIEGKNGIIFEYKNYEDMYNKTLEFLNSGKINDYKEESKKLARQSDLDILLDSFKKELQR